MSEPIEKWLKPNINLNKCLVKAISILNSNPQAKDK